MRQTDSLVRVAAALMTAPNDRHWGYQTAKGAGVRSGVLYPILRRLLEHEWLSDGWEDPAQTEGRPPRRYYELTELGKQELGAVLARARQERAARPDPLRQPSLGWTIT